MGMGTGGSPVDMSVGAASYGSNGGAGLSMGIPTQQKYAAGMAIYVPPAGPDTSRHYAPPENYGPATPETSDSDTGAPPED